MDVWKIILIAAAVGVAFGIIGFILGGLHRKRVAEAAIGSATKEANRIVSEAMTQAEAKKKEAILEAKDEIHKQRSENEKELRERRNEVQRQERRVIQKEESLDKKIENQISFLTQDRGHKFIKLVVSPYVAAFLRKGLWSLRRRWEWKYKVRLEIAEDQSIGIVEIHYHDKKDNDLITK